LVKAEHDQFLGGMMKEILALIESKKRGFSQLPFFEYLRDQSIAPKQRLAFAPCAAPFVMSFGELNRLVFRDEPTNDPIQTIINKHTYEDDHHWLWFLEDLEKLGLNPHGSFTDALRFIWGEETSVSRRITYELYRHAVGATPIQKMIIMEVIEATGHAVWQPFSQVIRELQALTEPHLSKPIVYRYFGIGHLMVEPGHTYASNTEQSVQSIQLSEESKANLSILVDRIFSVFEDLVDELLNFAKAHRFDHAIFESTTQGTQNVKPIGSYLIEAGLIRSEQLQEALSQQKTTSLPIGEILAGNGWIRQETIEYFMDKIVCAERRLDVDNTSGLSTRSTKPTLLGAYLIDAALVSPEQVQDALGEQKISFMPIGQILSRKGFVSQQTVEYLMEKVILPEQKVAILN
jgi:hypothetical protein